MLRQRQHETPGTKKPELSASKAPSPSAYRTSSKTGISTAMVGSDSLREPLLKADPRDAAPLSGRPPSPTSPPQPPSPAVQEDAAKMNMQNMSRKSQWIVLAVASGACAAFNGVFAKLTTTELTTSFATGIANILGLGKGEKVVEVVIRGMFFGLNLIFNGIMWALFTKALARGTSTTQVSIINTSSNFMITAVLGFIIFSESLPPLWWLGAAMLVAGNVIIGRREEDEPAKDGDDHVRAENGDGAYTDEGGELLTNEDVELDEGMDARRGKQDEDDVLQLDLDDEEGKTVS